MTMCRNNIENTQTDLMPEPGVTTIKPIAIADPQPRRGGEGFGVEK